MKKKYDKCSTKLSPEKLAEITKGIQQGSIRIQGLGRFFQKTNKGRETYNFQTGLIRRIDDYIVIRFEPSTTLKKKVILK